MGFERKCVYAQSEGCGFLLKMIGDFVWIKLKRALASEYLNSLGLSWGVYPFCPILITTDISRALARKCAVYVNDLLLI